MNTFPDIPKQLLDELNRRFPERSPEPNWDDRKIWTEVGKRQLVRLLNIEFDKQNNPKEKPRP